MKEEETDKIQVDSKGVIGVYDYMNESSSMVNPVQIQLLGAHGIQGYLTQKKPAVFRSGDIIYVAPSVSGLSNKKVRSLIRTSAKELDNKDFKGNDKKTVEEFVQIASGKNVDKQTVFFAYPVYKNAETEEGSENKGDKYWASGVVTWKHPKGPGQRMLGSDWADTSSVEYLQEFIERGGDFVVFQMPKKYNDHFNTVFEVSEQALDKYLTSTKPVENEDAATDSPVDDIDKADIDTDTDNTTDE